MKLTPTARDAAHKQAPKVAILLLNLGTPDEPTSGSVRRYLREFLNDTRIVDLPRWLWWPILYGFILSFRPPKVAQAYRQIWHAERGSPLRYLTAELAAGLGQWLNSRRAQPVQVAYAMRYGNPSVPAVLDELTAGGVRRILVLPLFPQYSATTTGSGFDAIARWSMRQPWVPEWRMVSDYSQHDGYLTAIAESLRGHWQQHGRGEKLLFSFHGIPRRYFHAGDPYHCQCHATARRIAERLDLAATDYEVVFQSRFGREPWLKPYADLRVLELARAGVKTVDVICPGFAVDCLETLEEIAERLAEDFVHAGGQWLHYVPALNASAAHIAALGAIVEAHQWSDTSHVEPADLRVARGAALAHNQP